MYGDGATIMGTDHTTNWVDRRDGGQTIFSRHAKQASLEFVTVAVFSSVLFWDPTTEPHPTNQTCLRPSVCLTAETLHSLERGGDATRLLFYRFYDLILR